MSTLFSEACRHVVARLLVPFLLLLSVASLSRAELEIDRPPINYQTAEVNDAVAQLMKKMESGETKLEWDDKHGWLPSLMRELNVSESSQTLVFSKTSLQFSKIAPKRPRALYYNDDVYLGVVQYGDLVEISAVDAKQGAIFYTLKQKNTPSPVIKRDRGQCLSCHNGHRTQDVPGYLVRSVYPGEDGNPVFSLGSTTSDQTTELLERYGGWYVTGLHGDQRHRGNLIANADSGAKEEGAKAIDFDKGANLKELSSLVSTEPYLTPHSDLVALMVLDHQTQMHNFITKASYEARQADHYDETWNKILERPADYRAEVSQRRIDKAAEQMLQYLLFADEFKLTAKIEGSSDFAEKFQQLGPRDSQGRSLRDFDLKTRLFKYPCSYLIYSDSFDALPETIREVIVRQMMERGMLDLTHAENWADAWRVFFEPGDVVGVKLNPVGQPAVISAPEVLHPIIDGLEQAGIKRKDIVVYDRYHDQFLNAGFEKWLPEGVRWMSASEKFVNIQMDMEGYDRDTYMEMPLVHPDYKEDYSLDDPHIRRSYVSNFFSKEINKMVNLCLLKHHQSAGVTLALKNMSHGLVNNVNRSHASTTANACGLFIPAVVDLPIVREKNVLNILDGVKAAYHGAPGGSVAKYSWEHKTMYFATDPVALDKTGWKAIDKKRAEVGVAPIALLKPDQDSQWLNVMSSTSRSRGTSVWVSSTTRRFASSASI